VALRGIRRLIDTVDPNVPVGEDMALSEQVRLEYTPVLLAQNVLSFCGVLALLLSAMGLYSTIAFAVRTRTREIGIRMAVGARRGDVFRLVIGQGTRLTILGIVMGTMAGMIVTRLLAGLLFGVSTLDPATYASVTVLLGFVALSACCLPARRATQVDPVQSLRAE
jgi:ABC-type antimicrobial peptide transport system permease subunit